jgi:ATP-dependent Lhr-like helicase
VLLEPDDVEDLVTTELGGSALFAARFRECAARALLLPRRTPASGSRCGSSASAPPSCCRWPAGTAASRSCSRRCASACRTCSTSRAGGAHARGAVARGQARRGRDAAAVAVRAQPAVRVRRAVPLRGRRAAGRAPGRGAALDPGLLAELLGRGEGASLRDLLDPAALARTEGELQRLARSGGCAASRASPTCCACWAPRRRRGRRPRRVEPDDEEPAPLATRPAGSRRSRTRGASSGCASRASSSGRRRGRRPLQDALGTPAAGRRRRGVHRARARPAGRPARAVRTHPRAVPGAAAAAARSASARPSSPRRCGGSWHRAGWSRASCGRSSPAAGTGTEWCDAEVLRTIRRRSLAALRARWSPCPRATSPGSCRRGRAWGRRCGGPRGCCGPWSSSRRGRARRARSRRSCCPPACPGTRRPCSTSSRRPARWSGRGTGRCRATTGGWPCTRPTSRR